MKAIERCCECAYYSMRTHKCKRGAKDKGEPTARFYADCPLDEADMPAADAVKVVRCKDCIYAQDSDDDDVQYNIGRICTCAVNEDYVLMRWADDFCSYGERRDDD